MFIGGKCNERNDRLQAFYQLIGNFRHWLVPIIMAPKTMTLETLEENLVETLHGTAECGNIRRIRQQKKTEVKLSSNELSESKM